MTVTYSTDLQVEQRCPLVVAGLAAVNAALTAGSIANITLDTERVEAQRQILVALRAKGITDDAQISRPDDLREAEIALTIALVCEGAQQRVSVQRGGLQPEVYAQQAEWWRERYREEIEKAAPIDGVKSTGRTFEWGRG